MFFDKMWAYITELGPLKEWNSPESERSDWTDPKHARIQQMVWLTLND